MKNICSNCGSLDTLKNKSEGSNRVSSLIIMFIFCSILAAIVWWLAVSIFTIGVIILLLSKSKRDFTVCQSCNAENSFININTPKGKELLESYHKDIKQEETKPITKQQSWHGLW